MKRQNLYEFSQLVKKHRMESNLSLQEVANLCDVKITASYISRLELGERENPTFKICMALCKALNIDLREVFRAFEAEDIYDKAIKREIIKKLVNKDEEIARIPVAKEYVNEVLEGFYEQVFGEGKEKNHDDF